MPGRLCHEVQSGPVRKVPVPDDSSRIVDHDHVVARRPHRDCHEPGCGVLSARHKAREIDRESAGFEIQRLSHYLRTRSERHHVKLVAARRFQTQHGNDGSLIDKGNRWSAISAGARDTG